MIDWIASVGIWALVLTLALYQLGLWIQKKTGLALCNPILIASALMILLLLGLDIPNSAYQKGMEKISWLLTPSTVCLAIPLYTQMHILKGNFKAILLGIGGGTLASIGLILGFCAVFGLEHTMQITLLPKSVTSAMAIALSERGGGIVALTAAAVIVTGVFGNMAGPWLCRRFRITDPIAQGVAYGTAAHVIGTAKAREHSELAGAVSSLSLVVAGILTALVFPLFL